MLSNKELKAIVKYLEMVIFKKISDWRSRRYDTAYVCNSKVLREYLRIPVVVSYYIEKGKLSITKHDNKIFFGVENLIRSDVGSRDIDNFSSGLILNISQGLRNHCDVEYDESYELANKCFQLWRDAGGLDNICDSVQKGYKNIVRGEFQIPCDGLNEKIIPIASLDLETMAVRYPKSKSQSWGAKVAVANILFTDKGTWRNTWSSPDFLHGFSFPESLISTSGVEIDDDVKMDEILKSILHERYPNTY